MGARQMQSRLPLSDVRAGGAADVAAIMNVMTCAFDPRFGEAWSADQVRGALSMPGCSLLMVEHYSQVSGFALVRSVLDEAELLLIAVRPESHRLGTGKRLLQLVIDRAREGGVKRLHVEVREDNPALRFYINSGFSKVGERPNYYRRSDAGPTTAISLCYSIS